MKIGNSMWYQIQTLLAGVQQQARHLSREEWLVVFVVAVVIGVLCMRGFGSRTRY
jgi:hypothetical protein